MTVESRMVEPPSGFMRSTGNHHHPWLRAPVCLLLTGCVTHYDGLNYMDVGEKMARNVGGQRLAVALAGAALFLAGCASRPSADALTQSILDAAEVDATVSLTEAQARCIADELLDSNLSDAAVAGLAENFDEPEVLASDADSVESTVAEAAIVCAQS